MPFVPEDGTGLANANSLTTVEFADTYHAERGNDAWGPLTVPVKQQLLIKATDYVAGKYAMVFAGTKAFAGQALPFPRIIGYDNVGNPVGVQQAVAELALVANTASLSPNISRGKKRVKVGPIEVEYDGNSPSQTQFVTAVLKLAPWLKAASHGHMARLIRT